MIELVWLAVLFPLLGAAVNGLLAARGSRAKGLVSAVGVGTFSVAQRDAKWIHRLLETSEMVAGFRVHEVDG